MKDNTELMDLLEEADSLILSQPFDAQVEIAIGDILQSAWYRSSDMGFLTTWAQFQADFLAQSPEYPEAEYPYIKKFSDVIKRFRDELVTLTAAYRKEIEDAEVKEDEKRYTEESK